MKKKKKKERKNKRSRREAKETTRTITPAPRCRFALCANVLLAPSREMRSKILLNIHNALDASGTLLLVVPSTESVLFTELMLRRWDAEAAKDEGLLSSKFKVEGGKKIKCKKKGTGAKARPRSTSFCAGLLPSLLSLYDLIDAYALTPFTLSTPVQGSVSTTSSAVSCRPAGSRRNTF